MPETKYCSRCDLPFECCADRVTDCHCIGVGLAEALREEIAGKYDDCLCSKCLQEVIANKNAIAIESAIAKENPG